MTHENTTPTAPAESEPWAWSLRDSSADTPAANAARTVTWISPGMLWPEGVPGTIEIIPLFRRPPNPIQGVSDAAIADANRYNAFFNAGLPVTFMGQDYRTKAELDAAIDAFIVGPAQSALSPIAGAEDGCGCCATGCPAGQCRHAKENP